MFDIKNIRPVKQSDLVSLKSVLDQTELFPSEMLDEMISPFFNDNECTDYWTTYEHEGMPVCLLYCEQERMTEGTWNVLAVAVLPELQSKGLGALLMANIEQTLINNQQNTLLVETSGLPEYERTRLFYDNIGYTREAVIRDFYAKGEDKVIFWKSLN